MKISNSAALIIALALTSGCGGGGESSSETPPVTISNPSSPMPAPAPAPSPIYQSFDTIDADWSTSRAFAWTELVRRYDSSAEILSLSSGLETHHGIIEAAFSGPPSIASHFYDFSRAKYFDFTENEISFRDENSYLLEVNPNSRDYGNIAFSNQYNSNKNQHYIFKFMMKIVSDISYISETSPFKKTNIRYSYYAGYPTQRSDFPAANTGYQIRLETGVVDNDKSPPFSGVGNFSLDPVSNLVAGNITISQIAWTSGTDPISVTLSLSGSLDQGSSLISGTIKSNDNSYSGGFEGLLYGPSGRELGLFFFLKKADDSIISSGLISGVQPSFLMND
ncbi:MAG: hypothetical protein R3E04_12000 [Sphingobium sp.]